MAGNPALRWSWNEHQGRVLGVFCFDATFLALAGLTRLGLAHHSAATVDTDTGPHLHANWTWAQSALDDAQVSRLSQLWFDALAGICAHVQGGGGGVVAVTVMVSGPRVVDRPPESMATTVTACVPRESDTAE